MTLISVPATIDRIEELSAKPSASAITSTFRKSGAAISDVSSWTRSRGAPATWSGRGAEAAGHAMTRFAGDTDAVVAALEKVTTACELYVSQVEELTTRRTTLEGRRESLNGRIETLTADINAFEGDDTSALESRARDLRSEAATLGSDITDFWTDVTRAEDRVIAAFGSVDTTGEGRDRADDGSRPDTDALKDELAGLGGDTDRINAWWKGLTEAQREALKISDPDLIGNTNGIPTGDRDEANRTQLANDIDRLSAIPADERDATERALLERAKAAREALGVPGADVDSITGEPVDVNLLVYQPGAFGGDGAVAVSYGDPDTADNTAIIVPGINNDGTTIVGNGEDAYRLFKQAQLNQESTATIAWMGYDSPSYNPKDLLASPGEVLDMGSVIGEGRATRGGELLSDLVDGLRSTDEGERSHLSVIGHSYGSTTVSHAAHDHHLDADSLTLIGSPGAGGDDVNHSRDLNMPEGKVYAGAADNDFVTWLGRDGDVGMGQDPTQKDFGATVFGVDPGKDFHADNLDQGITNHTSYFDKDSRSLESLTQIVQGDEPDVVTGRTDSANSYATDWVKDEVVHQVKKEYEESKQEIEDGLKATKDFAENRIDDVKGWFDK